MNGEDFSYSKLKAILVWKINYIAHRKELTMSIPDICHGCLMEHKCDHNRGCGGTKSSSSSSSSSSGNSTYDSHAAERAAMWEAAERAQMLRSLRGE